MKNGPPAVWSVCGRMRRDALYVTQQEEERQCQMFTVRCASLSLISCHTDFSLLSQLHLDFSRARVSSITLISRLGVRCNCTVHIFALVYSLCVYVSLSLSLSFSLVRHLITLLLLFSCPRSAVCAARTAVVCSKSLIIIWSICCEEWPE